MSKVINLHGPSVDEILKQAIKDELTDLVLVGMDKDGYEYFAAHVGSLAEGYFLLSRARNHMMEEVDDE
jgi:hypothetical protein